MTKTLWCIETNGMDEFEPVPSLKVARERCHAMNALIIETGRDDENEPNIWCIPAVWRWGEEMHAEELAELATGGR